MKVSTDVDITYREVRDTDVPLCVVIESASYPVDEAASEEKLWYRQRHATQYFQCALIDDEIIGFVCGTRCWEFTEESMSVHVSNGPLLAIHSVVVREDRRRKGIATAMLKEYVSRVRQDEQKRDNLNKIVLLSKAHLLAFYVNCGFSVTRPSQIVHGSEQWYELELAVRGDTGWPCFIVDAFADPSNPTGTGNPAACVVFDSEVMNEESLRPWTQAVAAEFNLSETAFIWPSQLTKTQEREVHYQIRYYTPTQEVDLCGHATLASAAVLFDNNMCQHDQEIVFHAKKDILRASREFQPYYEATISGITMEFPVKPAYEISCESDRNAIESMLLSSIGVSKNHIIFMGLSMELGDLLIEISTEAFAAIGFDNIDFAAFYKWDGYSRGVIVCSLAKDQNFDFQSRFFGPKAGINEDPVTGSAHCVLAPHFASKLGKESVIGFQMSKRGGRIVCEMKPPTAGSQVPLVCLTGSAATTMKGRLVM